MPTAVLMYHEVEPPSRVDKHYTLGEDAFDAQMGWLAERGYATCLLDEHWEPRTLGRAAATTVAITFDDSHVNHHANSLPLLRKHGLSATFFVVTGLIDQDPAWLTRAQLIELADAGMSIQSHTHTHRFLDALPTADLRDELRRSRQQLEDWLGRPVHHLSCPGGRHDRRVLDEAGDAGYRTVSTSIPGVASPAGSGLAVLPRLLVTGGTSMAQFKRAAAGDGRYVLPRRAAYEGRRIVKRCLGNSLYQRVWQSIYRSDDEAKRTAGATTQEN